MPSPAGLQHSQANFIAQWMPSSSRAGVILNPSPDLAESLRHSSTRGPPSQDPNDSFTSDFAPLPASTNSSCLSVDALAHLECGTELGNLKQRLGGTGIVMSNKPFAGLHYTPPKDTVVAVGGLEELVNQSQDPSLIMKLDQLRQWQQHMQEQLKARQLEELLRLQEEQQRMLGMLNGSDHTGADCTGRSGLSGTDWEESTLGADSPRREAPYSATLTSHSVPQSVPRGPCQEPVSPPTWRHGQPQRGLDHEEQDKGTDAWSSDKEDDQEEHIDAGCNEHDATMVPRDGAAMTEDHCRGEERDLPSQDRPIMPGIGGQKQTFEELLEEQLRLEEQKLKSTRQQQQNQDEANGVRPPPKRDFLKRGEGLLRFTNSRKASLPNREVKKDPKPQPLARVNSCRSSEPKTTLKANISSSQRPPVQRKTAVLNKENHPKDLYSPPSDIRAESRTVGPKVLGNHQRQNMGGTGCIQTDLQVRRHQQCQLGPAMDSSCRKLGHSVQAANKSETCYGPPNAVTKQIGVAEGSAAQNEMRAKENRCGSRQESSQGKGGEVPEYSIELSFQERMRRWMCERQKESVELGEFELLEQAAEELSFSSNSSFVMKVLQMDEHHRQLQTAEGLHSRRLSSTPIKSPRPSPPTAFQRDGTSIGRSCSSDGMISKSSSSDSEALARKTGDDRLVNKVSDGDDEEEDAGDDSESKRETSDISFCSSSEFGDQEVAVNPPTFPSNHCFSTSNPPYDKRSYQDQDCHRKAVLDLTEGEDGESDCVLTNPEDSTLTEDKDDQQGRLVFDDDDTWNDIEEAVGGLPNSSARASPVCVATANNSPPPERALKRKVAVARGVALDRGGVVSSANQELNPSPPATSQLMAKLFPSLKPRAQTVPPPAPAPTAPEPKKDEEAPGQQVQSRQLRERLVELELEIERFKRENTALTKLRQENGKNQESLRKERVEFEQRKAEELAKFEDYKREETRKLQKERKVFERHASAARAIPDKREREEIQSLKQQLSSLQEELRRRESRWSTTHSRLRQQIDSLSADNSSLRDEVRTLEKLRLTAWRRSHSEGEKDKERGEKDKREGLRMFESSGASTAKGVKFASPLDTRRSSSPQSSSTVPIRWSPRESIVAATAGMKSSLRKSSNAGLSSSAVPGRTTEERAPSVTRTQDKPLNQDHSCNVSPNRECLPTETESTEVKEPESNQETITHPDGKMEKVLPCGGRLIVFPNGTRKELSADGLTAKVTFFNGDTKQVMADQRVIYYYADAQTTHTTYPDGMDVLQFPNNQTEKHFPDGRKEITFPDQTIKNLYPDGREESVLTDGTIIQVNPDGSKEIQFNTGQKEVHTAEYKRREYPDGTVKTVYTDGRQETHYPTGRIRFKDKDGNVVMDNKV